MRIERRKKREKEKIHGASLRVAVSLVELLIAIVILASVFVGIFQGIFTGVRGTERLIEESFASNHAISLLEALGAVSYSDLPDIPADTTDANVRTMLASVPGFVFPGAPNADYQRTVEVREVSRQTDDPADLANSRWGALKAIRVEVTWKCQYRPAKPSKTLVFQTLITNDTEVSR